MEVFNFFNVSWLLNLPGLHHVLLFATAWTIACQATLSMEFSRQEYWSGLPFPTLGDLPDPGDWTCIFCVYCVCGGFLTNVPPGKPLSISLTLTNRWPRVSVSAKILLVNSELRTSKMNSAVLGALGCKKNMTQSVPPRRLQSTREDGKTTASGEQVWVT